MTPMTSPIAFKDTFTFGRYRHDRISAAPDFPLIAGSHREAKDDAIGKVHVDTYAAATPPVRLFARIYHVASGCFAWYAVAEQVAGPTPEEREKP